VASSWLHSESQAGLGYLVRLPSQKTKEGQEGGWGRKGDEEGKGEKGREGKGRKEERKKERGKGREREGKRRT
jgi:hypothetical protein